jgi:hypothetical protein
MLLILNPETQEESLVLRLHLEEQGQIFPESGEVQDLGRAVEESQMRWLIVGPTFAW